MRQAGFKPKGHNSGTYWVRANAQTGGKKQKKEIKPAVKDAQGNEVDDSLDLNGDGIYDKWDIWELRAKHLGAYIGIGLAIIVTIFALIVA